MKKVVIALAVTLLAGAGTLAATSEASAQYRHRHHHHHHRGPGIAPLIGGLAAGAIIGGAIASSRPAYAEPPPAYYAPRYAPAPVEYYEEPACAIESQRYWDGFNWRVRNVRVCD
ncbi:hypothetical protein [Bradyrhizobium sp. LHD-71]|uniref:hypothetical protein n=1 Tax=Bradyrhizobium sp. LHD-71 TaxID=3072141 RepID=UPI00280D9397|nr:hypothetical protein [Bradyrhizobium sp. LHD-71]MDQ8727770.1 hypothetical protein [Bradyrhizobium sp. LHD-71]